VAYSTVAAVKEILHIDFSESAHDSEIANCIEDAEAWINKNLEEHTSVPLALPSQLIVFASKYMAAALFKEKEESEKAQALYQRFHKRASEALEDYIQETYHQAKMRRV
jgi:predicted metal-dependent hydrolase